MNQNFDEKNTIKINVLHNKNKQSWNSLIMIRMLSHPYREVNDKTNHTIYKKKTVNHPLKLKLSVTNKMTSAWKWERDFRRGYAPSARKQNMKNLYFINL